MALILIAVGLVMAWVFIIGVTVIFVNRIERLEQRVRDLQHDH